MEHLHTQTGNIPDTNMYIVNPNTINHNTIIFYKH